MCAILGIQKLNTTACPACNGMVEHFNCTMKTTLCKHAGRFGDRYLTGILWAYRNTPHDTTGEKPSFLLFGTDLRAPTDTAFLPTSSVTPTDYRKELMLSLSNACDIAMQSIQKSQKQYEKHYDAKVSNLDALNMRNIPIFKSQECSIEASHTYLLITS
jgi:hypothetical protein